MLIVLVLVAFLGALSLAALGRSRRFNEIDRFHRASRMTTEWARSGVTRPVIAAQEAPQDHPTTAEARDT
jgi:type II secretory pathway pseudopilin PulG